MDNLEYAEMLEIPVNTVNVVKKKSLFSRRKADKNQDLKDDILASVNSRADSDEFSARADFIQTEDLTEPPMTRTKSRDGINGILIAEAVAACLIAGGIFITNALVDNTAINNLVAGLSQPAEQEVSYTDLELSSVVSQLSDTEVSQTSGVISFTGQTAVYPVCEGTISSVTQTDGLYTVEIAHTSTFSSVFTGLTTVYSAVGDEVKANIPFAYSDGQNEVRVSMYDGQTLISGYTLEGAVPVWNS